MLGEINPVVECFWTTKPLPETGFRDLPLLLAMATVFPCPGATNDGIDGTGSGTRKAQGRCMEEIR